MSDNQIQAGPAPESIRADGYENLARLREQVAVLDAVLESLTHEIVQCAILGEGADVRVLLAAQDIGGAMHHLDDLLEGEERRRAGKPPRIMVVECCGACEAHCGETCGHRDAEPRCIERRIPKEVA